MSETEGGTFNRQAAQVRPAKSKIWGLTSPLVSDAPGRDPGESPQKKKPKKGLLPGFSTRFPVARCLGEQSLRHGVPPRHLPLLGGGRAQKTKTGRLLLADRFFA